MQKQLQSDNSMKKCLLIAMIFVNCKADYCSKELPKSISLIKVGEYLDGIYMVLWVRGDDSVYFTGNGFDNDWLHKGIWAQASDTCFLKTKFFKYLNK